MIKLADTKNYHDAKIALFPQNIPQNIFKTEILRGFLHFS